MPAVTVGCALCAVRNEAASSPQQPQQLATPNCDCKSPIVVAPAAMVSLIWWSVTALQMQTNILCSVCSQTIVPIAAFIIVCKYK